MEYLVARNNDAGSAVMATSGTYSTSEEAWAAKERAEKITGKVWEVWLIEFHYKTEGPNDK